MRSPYGKKNLFFVAVLVFFITKISGQTNNCQVIGFWRGSDGEKINYLDFNEKQVLMINETEEGKCIIRDFGSYNISEDSLWIELYYKKEHKQSLIQFITCDSMILTPLYNKQPWPNGAIRLGRIDGHLCDQPEGFLFNPPLTKRHGFRDGVGDIFVFLYGPMLIIWFFFYLKKRRDVSFLIWIVMAIMALIFSFFLESIFLYFVLNISILVQRYLYHHKRLPVPAGVILYGCFAGLIIMIEYIIRFGQKEFTVYTSLVPVLVNLVGIRLAFRLLKKLYLFFLPQTLADALIRDIEEQYRGNFIGALKTPRFDALMYSLLFTILLQGVPQYIIASFHFSAADFVFSYLLFWK